MFVEVVPPDDRGGRGWGGSGHLTDRGPSATPTGDRIPGTQRRLRCRLLWHDAVVSADRTDAPAGTSRDSGIQRDVAIW